MDETKQETADLTKANSPKDEKTPSKSSRGKIKDIRGEFRKIIWPTRKELVKQTATVIITSLIFGVIIVSMDAGFAALLKAFSSLVSGQ